MKALAPLALAALAACSSMSHPTSDAVTSRPFGIQRDGRPATLWTLRSEHLEIDVTDYGATLVAVRMPDRAGRWQDVVLGFDSVEGYQSSANQYFGCTTGRVCNRIKDGVFTLDGYTYRLAVNNPPNHLHGGAARSLDKVHWRGEVVTGRGGMPGVRFTYRSPDGEEGYPGNLDVAVTYWLMPFPGELWLQYEATTDRRTPVNLTNHAYWNLAGEGAPTVLDHVLQVAALDYTPTDAGLVPTGALARVAGTPLDFRSPQPLGLRLAELEATPAKGYDHNLVLQPEAKVHARLAHPGSGRWLEIHTTEPGLQVYSGNFLFGQAGKGGKAYAHRSAVCLETQHFPDAVNQPTFPSTILVPGETFRSTTQLRFGVD